MSHWSGLALVADDNTDNPCILGSVVCVWDVVNAYDDGNSSQQIARTCKLPLHTVQTILAFTHRYLPERDPINWGACDAVECVQGRCGGVPVLKGTRVPVSCVLENLADGMSVKDFADEFDVNVAAVQVVSEFIAELRRLPLAS